MIYSKTRFLTAVDVFERKTRRRLLVVTKKKVHLTQLPIARPRILRDPAALLGIPIIKVALQNLDKVRV